MKKNLTEIVFILDRSGSMSGLEADTIGGFNSMIEKQRKADGEALVSTVLFDNMSEVIHDRVDIRDIKSMTDRDYTARGCTLFWMPSAEQFITLEMSISTQEKRMSLNILCSSSRRMAWRMQAADMTARKSRR